MVDTFFQDTPAPPPAAPAAPTVDMETAGDGLPGFEVPEQPDFDKPTFGRQPAEEGPRQTAAPSSTPPPTQPDPRTDELHAQVSNLEKRLSDTQAYANHQAQQSNAASEMLAAIDQREQQRQQAYQQAAMLQPPQVADKDALLTDPEAIEGLNRDYAEWGYRRAQSEYAPLISMASDLAAVQPQLLQLGEQYAWWQAQAWAEHDGISAEEFAEFAPAVRNIIGSYTNNPAQVQAALMNPESIRWATHMARSQSGKPAPIQGEAKAPPSPPSGSGGGGAPRQAKAKGKPQFIQMAEQRFGVKIPDDKVEAYRGQFG